MRSRAEVSAHIDHIKQLVRQLAGMPPASDDAFTLADRIRDNLDALKRHLAE